MDIFQKYKCRVTTCVFWIKKMRNRATIINIIISLGFISKYPYLLVMKKRNRRYRRVTFFIYQVLVSIDISPFNCYKKIMIMMSTSHYN